MLDSFNNPYTTIFISCIFIGAFLGFIYKYSSNDASGMDNWSSNLVSTMIFGAAAFTIISLFIIHNPIFPIPLQHKNPHILTISEFKAKMGLKNAVVLDLRSQQEYQQAHLKNAISFDFYDPKLQSKIDNLERYKIYLLYCSRTEICRRTQKILTHQGFYHVFYTTILSTENF